jgi:DNA transposition AAA+ family ATPase
MTELSNAATDPWAVPFKDPEIDAEELERWRRLRSTLIETARRFGWSKSEVSKRSGVPAGTLWQWFDGSYRGVISNQSDRIANWLDSAAELTSAAARLPMAPGFVMTPTSNEIIDALIFAQAMPEIVVVTTGAGMGKTKTIRQFCGSRPHASIVTMRPTTATVHGMLLEIGRALSVTERNPAKLDSTIGAKLQRNGRHTLLVIDEAQNLSDQAVNQLRYFLDVYEVGIALIGNEELYGRFGGNEMAPAYAQLQSRFGLRFRRMQPLPEDVNAIVDAWGLEADAEPIRRLCQVVAKKPGALRLVTKGLQLAGMYAAGDQRPISVKDFQLALSNRGLEVH